MRRPIKNLMAVIASTAVIGCFILVSCEKNQDKSDIIPSAKIKIGTIPYFPNEQSLEDAISTAVSFDNISDLQDFEEKSGRQSIGALADAFYETFKSEDFSDKESAIDFYTIHADLLDTLMEDGEIYIQPKMSHSIYRYAANQDGMFAVGDFVCKVFKSCVVTASMEYAQELQMLTDENLKDADTTIFFYTILPKISEHVGCEYDLGTKNKPTSSKDRIHIKLVTDKISYPGLPVDFLRTRIKVYNLHKWCGIWWTSRHTLSCNANVSFHHLTPDCTTWETATIQVSKTQKCNTLWVNVYDKEVHWDRMDYWDVLFRRYNKFYHYKYFDISASYPGHTVERFTSNN